MKNMITNLATFLLRLMAIGFIWSIPVFASVSKKHVTQKHKLINKVKDTSINKTKVTSRTKNMSTLGVNLGTDFNFDAMAVRGHYQSAFEGQAIVENEKPLNDLLDYRSNYSDRLMTAKGQM